VTFGVHWAPKAHSGGSVGGLGPARAGLVDSVMKNELCKSARLKKGQVQKEKIRVKKTR